MPVMVAVAGGLFVMCACCALALVYFNSAGAPLADATRTQQVRLSPAPTSLAATATATTATIQATQSNRISIPTDRPSNTPTPATIALPTNTTPPTVTASQPPRATSTATPLQANTQAPAPTQPPTAEPPTAEPPTAVPAPTEAPAFTLINLTSPVPVNGDATVTIQTEPGASCFLRYVTPAGNESEASGLGPQTADGNGVCSWTWKIGGRTNPGTGDLFVTANGVMQRFEIVIQ